ncbi:hypothetical protein AERO9A_10060 [Aeromonas salmonicida]|nr:hypothetical protein AERO9A_10060 [Aeromonas salmonicida]
MHVLGLPPAFNLSHDQTLQFKFGLRFRRSPAKVASYFPAAARLACVRPAASVQSEP